MHWSLVPHDPWPLQALGQYAEAVPTRAATRKVESFDIIVVDVAESASYSSYGSPDNAIRDTSSSSFWHRVEGQREHEVATRSSGLLS